MDIKNILTSVDNPAKQLIRENVANLKQWEKTGLLEGISSEYEKNAVSILLQNQAKQLISEANRTGTSAGSEEWAGVALPLVRRIFSEIVAKDFVSVQPMNLPSGLVFYLDFKYATAQPGFTTGSGKDSQADSVFGITGQEAKNVRPSGGLYGAGRFGYSINESVVNVVSGALSTTTFIPTSITTASANLYNYDDQFQASYLPDLNAGNFYTVTVSSSALPSYDKEGVRAFAISGANILGFFPEYTTTNNAGTQITFIVSASAKPVSASVAYHKQPTATSRGDFEDVGSTLDIPSMNLEMRSEPITAKTRKLKAEWTPEFAQDLNAYHSIDAEAELTSMLSEYISQEIDLEILDMLIRNANTTERWSARTGRTFDRATNQFTDYSTAQANASAYTQAEWFQTLGTKIQKVSNIIHQKTLRGGANFLVCSPQVATLIESMRGYSSDGDGAKFAMGVQKTGTLDGRYTIYKNPYMLDNQILMGFRGSQFLETGAVYAPYIPLMMTPLVYDPQNFTPRKGIMTRYAKKIVRPEFYGIIQIDALGDV
ncbi:capsid protein [Microcystis phage Mel-JY01]